MAQLPPKVPTMTQNWPSFPFQTMSSFPSSTSTASAAAAALSQQNSWVDEFLDFSSARRNFHRRSVSDPIAFVEAPSFVEECNRTSNDVGGGGVTGITCNNNCFEKLDDEQLRNMFSDDVPAMGPPTLSSSNPSSNNPSTPSDQNSENDEKTVSLTDPNFQPKTEPGEEDSSCEPRMQTQPSTNVSSDAIVDPKRIKRILANRQSAQRSRVRKLQYISELERSVTTLQTEVSALSPRVAFLDHQRLILTVDNSALKQRIAALAQDKIFKDAHQEALRKEIERLRQIYHEQNINKMGNKGTNHEAVQSPPAPLSNFNKNGTDQE